MKNVTLLGHELIHRETREECLEVWEGEPDACPSQLYTWAETDGQDGLCWSDLESFWVEYGIHPGQLDPVRLYEALVGHVVEKGIAYKTAVRWHEPRQDGKWMVTLLTPQAVLDFIEQKQTGARPDPGLTFEVENPEVLAGTTSRHVSFIRRNGKAHLITE